jgi:hypothetical protein
MRTDTIYHINYWLKRGFTEYEAKEKIEISKKETSWRCVEFWLKRGYTKEDALLEIKRKQSEISLKRDRSKKILNPYSEEYYRNQNINDDNKIKELIQERKDKSNPYKLLPIEKVSEMIENRKKTYYSKPIEERKKINKTRGKNKKQLIEKFGEDKFNLISFNRGKGTRKPYEKKFSKISMELFNTLNELNSDKVFYYGKNEKFILTSKNKKKGYYIDFLYENKIIEFNGDFWHFNPNIYLPEDFVMLMNKKTIAKEIWEEDKIKLNLLKSLGYDVLVIWESDYKTNKENIINICNEFLNG